MCNMKEMSNSELISTIVGKNAYKIAGVSVKSLYCMEDTVQLYQFGLTEDEATKLLASISLAKKMFCDSVVDSLKQIANSADAVSYFMPKLRYETCEEFWVMALDTHNKILATKKIFQGTLNNTSVHPREVFEFAVLSHAAAIVIAHNHPSGAATPSKYDDKLTKNLKKASEAMCIPLVDHVIIGDGEYYSYFEDDKL